MSRLEITRSRQKEKLVPSSCRVGWDPRREALVWERTVPKTAAKRIGEAEGESASQEDSQRKRCFIDGSTSWLTSVEAETVTRVQYYRTSTSQRGERT